ncbi:MAG TPA: ABC transporter ATP-binding protein [Devosiaceae bacterium]|nr:ABC transporter ATP-binding protein [Devosiaceae bacterium]
MAAESNVQEKPLLAVRDLVVELTRQGAAHPVVSGVSFDVWPGETVCVVGESGSGKTLLALSLLSLAEPPVKIRSGQILFEGTDTAALSTREKQKLRGDRIAMVFQDPMTSLNPVLTIGEQIIECVVAHQPRQSKAFMRDRAVELLSLVGVPAPRDRLSAYPHQISGGMRQRVLIAMALANNPRLIVADEPTTALDVTVQAQVMEAMQAACHKTGAALLLVTHNMGLVAENADRVLVFYAGRIVEAGRVEDVFSQPRHPYTRALLASIPAMDGAPEAELKTIEGEPPDFASLPAGCPFQPRCGLARPICRSTAPAAVEIAPGHLSACHFAAEMTEQLFSPAEVSA